MCWHIIVSDMQYVSLTIWDSSASLTLQPQWRPKAGPIVEAPALLHFGRAPAHQLAASHHLVARGTALAVIHRHLPALHALTTRTCHPDPLLKTQLLTAGMKGEKGEEKEAEREGGGMEGWGERRREDHSKKQDWWKWWSRERKGEIEASELGMKFIECVDRESRDTYRHKEREKKGMLSTPISPQRLRRVQSADTGQHSVLSFSPNII